jgi:hypothetical protein
MRFFNRVFPSKELKAVIGALEDVSYTLSSPAFASIKPRMVEYIYSNPEEINVALREHSSPRRYVCTLIFNWISHDLSAGNYNLFCMLSPEGESLLAALDYSIAELKRLGVEDKNNLDEVREAVLMNIELNGAMSCDEEDELE